MVMGKTKPIHGGGSAKFFTRTELAIRSTIHIVASWLLDDLMDTLGRNVRLCHSNTAAGADAATTTTATTCPRSCYGCRGGGTIRFFCIRPLLCIMTFVEFRVFTCPRRRALLFILLRLDKIEVVMPFTESIAFILRELVTGISSTVR